MWERASAREAPPVSAGHKVGAASPPRYGTRYTSN